MIKGYSKMKKTLAALAVLGAFAGSAMAADVTLYGVIDFGLNYQHIDGDSKGVDANDKLEMKSGQNSGSRFGLKGVEDLGNGMKVGFVLENGFDADDGSFDSNGDEKLFGRESQLFVEGAFGKVGFGRVGQFASALGTYGLLGNTSPFSSGWGSFTGIKFVQAAGHTRYDNTVTYQTPKFGGFQVMAQYSFQKDSSSDKKFGTEGKADTDRYYGAAATFNAENLYLVAIVDSVNYASNGTGAKPNNWDDSLTFTLGGNYDFGFMKLYAVGQYFDNVTGIGQSSGINADNTLGAYYTFTNGGEGWDLSLGVAVPCFGGTAKAHVGYIDAEDTEESKDTASRWNIAVGYDYNLSKRTSLYTAVTYVKDKVEYAAADKEDRDPSAVEFMAGIIHKF